MQPRPHRRERANIAGGVFEVHFNWNLNARFAGATGNANRRHTASFEPARENHWPTGKQVWRVGREGFLHLHVAPVDGNVRQRRAADAIKERIHHFRAAVLQAEVGHHAAPHLRHAVHQISIGRRSHAKAEDARVTQPIVHRAQNFPFVAYEAVGEKDDESKAF